MDLKKLNTSQLKFDPNGDSFLRDFDDYPEFDLKPWVYDISRRVALTYIVLMYDPKSDLIDQCPNYWQRKRIAAEIAGFPIEKTGDRKGYFSPQSEALLLGESDTFNRMCIRYCLLFHDVDYISLVSYMELFIQETMKIMEGNTEKDSKVLIQNIDSLNEKIRIISDKVFGGDEANALRKELYKSVLSEMIVLRPELIAKRLCTKEPPINRVYGYQGRS